MLSDQNLTAAIVPFYLGEKPDSADRTIGQMWTWDFEKLECVHDYIQWLFPLAEKSNFNPNAPIVDNEVIEAFKTNTLLQQNLLRSFSMMLSFYGLKVVKDKEGKTIVEKSPEYSIRKQEWVQMFDHNYLRITRILKCLMIFDRKEEAQAFYDCLRDIYKENTDLIGRETFQYWTDAVLTK